MHVTVLYIYTVMILRFILFALGAYIFYKVIFELVIPIFRVTRKVRRQFNDMQQHMHNQANAYQDNHNSQAKPDPKPHTASRAGDYIDFEEVK
jgi:hypothetical protein